MYLQKPEPFTSRSLSFSRLVTRYGSEKTRGGGAIVPLTEDERQMAVLARWVTG